MKQNDEIKITIILYHYAIYSNRIKNIILKEYYELFWFLFYMHS